MKRRDCTSVTGIALSIFCFRPILQFYPTSATTKLLYKVLSKVFVRTNRNSLFIYLGLTRILPKNSSQKLVAASGIVIVSL